MPRHCAICVHPERDRIDRAILGDESKASIARRWGLSTDCTERHAKLNHINRTLSKVTTRAEDALRNEGEDLVGKLQELIATAQEILGKAYQARQFGAALAGVRELARIFELIARLTGQLDQGTRINVLVQQQQEREAEQELMLERLTVAERLELRRLVAKAQGELLVPEFGVSEVVNSDVRMEGNGAAQSQSRSD
jgi:hypothetical protein